MYFGGLLYITNNMEPDQTAPKGLEKVKSMKKGAVW